MATVVNFNGKNHIEPGSYAATVYSPTSVANVAEFGNTMIIDTGLSINGGYEWAGGSGVNGELNSGLKSVYEFTSYEDFLEFTGGGLLGDLAEVLFTPISGAAGVPKLYYVRAATTKCASIDLTVSNGNTLSLKCKNEGTVGNGVVVSEVLKLGYGIQIVTGDTTGTFKAQIYRGTFMGTDASGEAFGQYTIDNSTPNMIAESGDITTLGELYDWASNDSVVTANFVVALAGDNSESLVAKTLTLAAGGTTTYLSGTEYADVLEAIAELDITFFLTTNLNADDGAGVNAATNGKLYTYLKQTAKFTEFMVVPGGRGNSDLFGDTDTSQAIAKYYNSGQVVCVHGAPVVTRKDRNGTKTLEPIYLAASIIGLNAGFGAAQTPLTFKRLGYQSYNYDLKKSEREEALQAGIMHTRNVSGYWRVNQGITTLLDNKLTYALDGQSFELSIELIKAQLNKELVLEGETRFTGLTAAQASPESVKNFTETKLESFVASIGNDNLLISWKNVKVVAKNSDYYITYDFVPNVPVNKTFFIGNVLDFSVEV